MKIYLFFLMIFMLLASCSGNDGYTVTVKGEGLDSIKIVLQNQIDHTARDPETVIPLVQTNGKVVFEGLVAAPCFSTLKLGEKNTENFVLSNTAIDITIDPVTGEIRKIKGGYQQEMKEEYDRLMNSEAKERIYKALNSAERGSDSFVRLSDSLKALSVSDKEIQMKFIEDHPDAMMSPYALWRIYGRVDEEEAIRLLNLIDTALSRQAQYAFVAKTIRAWERTPIGSEIPNLVQNDVHGNLVSLSDFRGKYLLIDFWASWCSPCRAANPGMVELYNKYNSKGIEFLVVSLDRDAEAWKKAITDDRLVWKHVSDLRYWDNEISRYFGINSIPATILVDPEGKVVAKKLNGGELEARLAELFVD